VLLCICNAGPAGRDLDVGALFEKYTIDEIRGIEKKTRSLLLLERVTLVTLADTAG